jgi:hypothetical protein
MNEENNKNGKNNHDTFTWLDLNYEENKKL